jgi:phosphatidylglycerol:prolipoprotein diacylglycerol transferase
MYPVLFEAGPITLYSYGFMIAIGIVAGMAYLVVVGKRELGLTFDQANALFLLIFFAAVVGGKLFLFFEDPLRYAEEPMQLLGGRGFVFYGSFLLAIPAMWLLFKAQKLPAHRMLDIMAITTCLVHIFGRFGCFLAGCCYGKPTTSALSATFTDPASYAEPLNTPLYPTQLMEASYILIIMLVLLGLKKRRRFYGQIFLTYLILYAAGRFVIEFFRGDSSRGFVMGNYLSHSQFIAICMFAAAVFIYIGWSRRFRNQAGVRPGK